MDTESKNLKPLVYRDYGGTVEIDLVTDRETVWLTQAQMGELFDRNKRTVSEHLVNLFAEDELDPSSVVRNFRTTAIDGKSYEVQHYNLDVIISVGYRVKSKRGTQFRQWATRVLRDYLQDGYAIDARRLRTDATRQASLNRLLKEAVRADMEPRVRADFLALLERYEKGLGLLDQYDHGTLEPNAGSRDSGLPERYRLTYADAREAIDRWKQSRYGPDRHPLEGTPAYKLDLFGIEKDGGFRSSIESIYQTFGGEEVYPSIEEKAANLIYFLVKNHAFSDGNKRIAAGLFIYFLDRNEALYREDGRPRVADNALVALTLFIAMSPPDQRDAVVAMTTNLINDRN